MKKIFMFLILGIFLISLASAGVSYEEENLTYNIDTIWPTWLGGSGESVVKLIENTDECLIDCSFTLEINNQKPISLLEDIKFINKKNEDVQDKINYLNFKVGRYENLTTTTPIYNTTCEDAYNETTGNLTQSCTETQIGEETETEEVLTWKDYNGEELDGLSYLKVDAKKNPKTTMDWIVTFRGEDLVKWAWWNTSWEYKRQIDLTADAGKFSYLATINYSSGMQSDFDDLRFVNSAEDTEFNYTIQDYTASDSATVRIYSQGETSFYMYYGNSEATSVSSASDTHFNPVSMYYLDETSGDVIDSVGTNDGTNYGSTRGVTGKINNAFDFDYTEIDGIYFTGSQLDITGSMTIGAWIKAGSRSSQLIVARDCGTAGTCIQYRLMVQFSKAYFMIGNTAGGAGIAGGITFVNDSEWHYVVGTFNLADNNVSIWVDGNYENSATFSGTQASASYTAIGRRIDANTITFDGLIDEIGIWDKSLTETQIQALYNYTAPTYTVGSEEETPGSISIDYRTPPTPENETELNVPYIPVNVSINYTNATLDNITYNFYKGDTLNQSYFFTNETLFVNHTGCTCDNWEFNVTACYTENIDSTSSCTSTETRLVYIDILQPSINVTSPTTEDYLYQDYNLTLTYNVSDVHLDTTIWEYNGTNTTLSPTNFSFNNYYFDYQVGENYGMLYVNDTFGNENSKNVSWDYKVLEVNQTYNEETTEGSLEDFLANLKLGSGYTIEDAVLFNYNDTETTGQAFTSGDYEILRKLNMLVPSVSTDTNFTFYWEITLSDDTEVNLSSKNQTVYNLAVDNCSSYTNELYNFTVVDEEEQTLLSNPIIETALNFYNSLRSEIVFNYSMQFEGVNPLRICLNRNLTNDSSYSLDVIVRYEDSDHANEYYNIINTTINNESTTERITLYDLNLSDSTDFQLTFTGSDFLPVEDALVYVDRQYISENIFKTVELPKTDYNGQTILHLVRNDIIYNIKVVKDGEVLGNFENIIAFCEDYSIGNCEIELNAFDSVEAVFNYDENLGIIFSEPTYNETTDKITFNFVTEDGDSKTVRLEVSRNDIFGNRSICNSTLTSSGGTLTCNIDPNLDESTLKTEIYVDEVLVVSGSVELDTSNYGVAGYLIMFVMAIAFALMFSGSKTGVLLSMGLTLIASVSLGLVTGDIIGIGASGLWLLVIIVIGVIKLNNERSQ